MKSRKIMWLTILVIGVWGTIGYRIYQSLEPEEMPIAPLVLKKINYADDSKENYPLSLNYDDPFLKKPLKQKAEAHRKQEAKRPAKLSVAATNIIVDWSRIEYLGSIYNASRKSFIASLRFDGVDYMAKQGELINGFKIETILKDSVQISLGPQLKFIKKK